MANWTEAQSAAINTKDKTLLISAAAGSGKTTVLIERIIRSLTDPDSPADISRMLIVTFTRAAASELRGRISAALSAAIAQRPNDKRLFSQLTMLGSAHISTIDSFYSDVVRQNSRRLDIPSSLRIADESELLPIAHKIMNRIIDSGYSGELGFSGDEFASVTETLCDMRNDSRLSEVFLDLYSKLLSHPNGISFLKESADFYDRSSCTDFFSSPIGEVIRDHVADQLEYMTAMMDTVCSFFSEGQFSDGAMLPPFEYDRSFCISAREAAINGGFDATRTILNGYKAKKRGSISAEEMTPEIQYHLDLRDSVKEKITKLKSTYFSDEFSSDDIKRQAEAISFRIRVIYRVLNEFDRIYLDEKLNRGICEFNDIKLWAYRLLVNGDGSPTDIANDISAGFDAVYIDEYQDVDLIQDMIFRAISKPRTRFMVGDVKQSIYGFRGAEPTLFMNYRKSFLPLESADEGDECTIFMSENFRCDKNIINFANLICSHIFQTGGREISYSRDDDLRFSKKVDDSYSGTPVKVALIDKKNHGDEPSAQEEDGECAYIVNEIKRLTSGEKKADGTPIRYSDIAVLYRSSSFGGRLAAALDKASIPHTYGDAKSIFDSPDVLLAISVLNAIDNPRRDTKLAGALISPIFGFTAGELIELRSVFPEGRDATLYELLLMGEKCDNKVTAEKCSAFLCDLKELRELSLSQPADKIIRYVFSKYSMLANTDDDGRSALMKLHENARSYEGDMFKGLYSYLKYIESMMENGNPISSSSKSGADAVNLMTIHKSKGLEFPVCFVGGCATPFNRDDAKDKLLYSQNLGVAMDIGDESGFGIIKTPFRLAISRQIYDRSSEEEMRVLYVALTRARERLYVTASLRFGLRRELNLARTRKLAATRASVLDAGCYISWILTALHGAIDNGFELICLTPDELTSAESCEYSAPLGVEKGAAVSESAIVDAEKIIEEVFNYEYPYLHISNIPAKLSVSRLTPNVLDISNDAPEEGGQSSLDTDLPALIRTPSFMSADSKVSGAQKGTYTHTFLQFCDFDKACRLGVKVELDRLISEGFIDKRAAGAVNLKQLSSFFESNLFRTLKNAKNIRREQRFNILLPADRFTSDPEYANSIKGEELLVQGVIDLIFETDNGDLVLCDYKTDFLTEEEIKDRRLAEEKLANKHRRQLSYYSAAVERIFGRAPDKVLIYSLPLGDSVVIMPETVD